MQVEKRRGRRFGVALALTLVAAAGLPSGANAGVAWVAQCVDNSGQGARAELASADSSSGNLTVRGCSSGGAGSISSTSAAGSNPTTPLTKDLVFTAPGTTYFVGGTLRRNLYGYRFSTNDGSPSWALGERVVDSAGTIIENCGGGSTDIVHGRCAEDANFTFFPSRFLTLPDRAARYYKVQFGCWVSSKCHHFYKSPGLTEVGGEFAVKDDGSPVVSSVTGGLATQDKVTSATADVLVNASDVGGLGVYQLVLRVGGQDVSTETWNFNGGACVDFDATARLLFRAGRPCLENPPSRRVFLPATDDGLVRVGVVVRDAAGNDTPALDRYVTIDRVPPVLSQDLTVTGTAQVGRQLTCAIGGVDGQEPTTAFQWVRTRADGSSAADIAGATAAAYEPTATDAGSKLLCRTTLTDRGGSSSRTSSATAGPFVGGATVAPAAATPAPSPGAPGTPGTNGGNGMNGSNGSSTTGAGTITLGTATATAPGPAGPGSTQGPALAAPGCPIGTIVTLEGASRLVTKRARSAAPIVGVVRSGNGAPAAGVVVDLIQRVRRSTAESPTTVTTGTSGADGRFSLKAPTGPSRDLQVITRSCGASGPVVRQTVRGAVQLKALTRRVRNGQSARFGGRVLGGYYGKGVGLELQVLVGRQWRDVRAVKTDRNGRFKTSYRFKRTYVRFTYRFRIATRAGSAWPYTASRSPIAKVQVN